MKAADWIRDKAGPTIREKFDGAKQKLQDPETHEKVGKVGIGKHFKGFWKFRTKGGGLGEGFNHILLFNGMKKKVKDN